MIQKPNQICTNFKMIDYREEILEYLIKERDFFKKEIKDIQRRRNEMYREKSTDEWDEINYAYESALFIKVFDLIVDKLSVPVDELYIELEDLKLSSIFEPPN